MEKTKENARNDREARGAEVKRPADEALDTRERGPASTSGQGSLKPDCAVCADTYLRSLEEKTAHALERLGGIGAAASAFHFCPSCGSPKLYSVHSRMWKCPTCGFEYFHNVATAAGIIIESQDTILMLKRHKEPMKGKFALPGGFVEPGERAEDAALRECYEEIGWSPAHIDFLTTFPNVYQYQGIPYATCDVYFFSHVDALDTEKLQLDPGECDSMRLVHTTAIPWSEIAFESAVRALCCFLRHEGIGIPRNVTDLDAID